MRTENGTLVGECLTVKFLLGDRGGEYSYSITTGELLEILSNHYDCQVYFEENKSAVILVKGKK